MTIDSHPSTTKTEIHWPEPSCLEKQIETGITSILNAPQMRSRWVDLVGRWIYNGEGAS